MPNTQDSAAPAEPHLAIRHTIAQAILRGRAATTDLSLIRAAERMLTIETGKHPES